MLSRLAWITMLIGTAMLPVSGCTSRGSSAHVKPGTVDYTKTALEIDYPDVVPTGYESVAGPVGPRSIRDQATMEYQDITLQEAIHLALKHSRVMIDLGGTVLRSPETLPTAFDPAAQETDPQFGVDAALSAFDAQFATSLFAEKNDRRYNNRFVGNLGFFQQEYDVFQAEITKRAATGDQFAIRKNVDFDRNSNLGNEFPRGAWDVYLEGEIRHPFLRRGGIEFNRIAGPGGQPGVYNGVLIARLRTDVSLADFEIGVRDLLSNVENAYWDLYFAYRDLDTKIRARDMALETWRRVHALYRTGRRGGEAEKEAQAREQFFRFEEEVQNALTGRLVEGTRTNNGTSPGTFRAVPGAYSAERRLRLIMGLPPNDRCMLRPADEPPVARVSFDWSNVANEAIVRREELQRQRWEIKRRELELIASKNFLLPNLDMVGRYRWRGFGRELLNPDAQDKPRFDNAYMDLTSGKFQEWQVGMELSLPIGFREGHAAVRNAELRVAQARAVLREQERQVATDLSAAISEVDRAYTVLETEINRVIAAKQQLDALQAAYESDKAEFFVVLDAQRRFAETESRYHQARVEYAIALRNVHFEKGSLLVYCAVSLGEGRWPAKAYLDAAQRERLRMFRLRTDYRLSRPNLVSPGPLPPADGTMPPATSDEEVPTPVPAPPASGPDPAPSNSAAASPEAVRPSPPRAPPQTVPKSPDRPAEPQPIPAAKQAAMALPESVREMRDVDTTPTAGPWLDPARWQ